MLSKKQWQWIADHHTAVRKTCSVIGAVLFVVYAGLVFEAMLKKGKAPAHIASNAARLAAGCPTHPPSGLGIYYLGPSSLHPNEAPIGYGNSNPLKFESFWPEIWDLKVLSEAPVCFNALLLDELTSPSDSVFYLYDKDRGEIVYKISRVK